jgi:signal transduction histidine kinase
MISIVITGPSFMGGVPVQISQLFSNLISNALKFTCDKKPLMQIKVSEIDGKAQFNGRLLQSNRQYYDISFTDNGSDLIKQCRADLRYLSKIAYQKRTGMGLAICKKICENHGGAIYADSASGQGATFHVILSKPDVV